MSATLNSKVAQNIGTNPIEVYLTPAGRSAVCIGANIANTSNQTIYCDVFIRKGGVDIYIVKGVFIPVSSAFVWSGATQKIILDEGDSFRVVSSLINSADVIVSVSEIS